MIASSLLAQCRRPFPRGFIERRRALSRYGSCSAQRMTMNPRATLGLPFLAAATALGLLACGGSQAVGTGDTKDAGAAADGNVDAVDARVGVRAPKKHRPTGSACSEDRTAGTLPADFQGCGTAGAPQCLKDSDCSIGKNGRCSQAPNGARCRSDCSYDACSSDSDCTGNVPCDCRVALPSSPAANLCRTGSDCRVDADCGPSGFCSPSDVRGSVCGWGDAQYFCHRPQDTCLDDSDCGGTTPCSFDPKKGFWECATLCGPPPP